VTGTVPLPGGTFLMGSNRHYPEEAPVRRVSVDPFSIDRCPVTNREFATFVADTGYATVAERPLDPAQFPGAPAENLVPGSLVFTMTSGPVDLRHMQQWWTWTPGASWRHPDGTGDSLAGRDDEPVVHVALETRRPSRRGPANSLRPRRNGSTRPAAGSRGRPTSGATRRSRRASRARTNGMATSPGARTKATAAGSRWVRSPPTDMGSTTWPETCGNGHPTGGPRGEPTLRARRAASLSKATTQPSPNSGSRAG
jgi:hypothetical protein